MLDNEAFVFFRCFFFFNSEAGHYHNGHRTVQSVVSFEVYEL